MFLDGLNCLYVSKQGLGLVRQRELTRGVRKTEIGICDSNQSQRTNTENKD
jgi:hypothetical protein